MIQILIFLLNILQTRSKIIKPVDKWICDYCAMGRFNSVQIRVYPIFPHTYRDRVSGESGRAQASRPSSGGSQGTELTEKIPPKGQGSGHNDIIYSSSIIAISIIYNLDNSFNIS